MNAEQSDPTLATSLAEARTFLVFDAKAEVGEMRRALAHQTIQALVQTDRGPQHPRHWLGEGGGYPINPKFITAEPLWRAEPLVVNGDLHPALARTLGDHDVLEPDDPQFIPRYWRLSDTALKILNRVPSTDRPPPRDAYVAPSGYALAYAFSTAARRRLGWPDDQPLLPVKIADVRLYFSQTRLIQLVLEVSYPVSHFPEAGVAIELMHGLARLLPAGGGGRWEGLGRLGPARAAEGTPGSPTTKEPITLRDVVHDLLGPEARPSEMSGDKVGRAFSYIMARSQAVLPAEAAAALALRLAQRHTADYSPQREGGLAKVVQGFETVTHACAYEGGALLVSPKTSDELPDFLKSYLNSVGESAYLVLALVAHKEFLDLLRLSQSAAITIEHEHRFDRKILSAKLRKLQLLQERLLNFRLGHRFSVASLVAPHNMVHLAWREVFRLDQMLLDISGDVATAESFLDRCDRLRAEHERRVREEKFEFFATLAASVIAALEIAEAGKPISEAIAAMRGLPTEYQLIALETAHALGMGRGAPDMRGWELTFSLVPLVASAIAFSIGAAFAYRRYKGAWRWTRDATAKPERSRASGGGPTPTRRR